MLQRGRWGPVLGRHVVAREMVQPIPLHTVTNRYGMQSCFGIDMGSRFATPDSSTLFLGVVRRGDMPTGWSGVSLSDVLERDSRAVKSSTHITI